MGDMPNEGVKMFEMRRFKKAFGFFWLLSVAQSVATQAVKVCQEKKQTDIFLNNTKVIAPTVKTQAKGLNNLSRALK